MPRRATILGLALLLFGLLLAAPVQAKSGELDYILITGPDGRQLEVLGGMLNGQLSESDRTSLAWPLLNGSMKGDERPPGDLGPRYDFIYMLSDVHDDRVKVRESVYLEADPPVAYAPRGQTSELYPGDVREVPWGWRPFPEAAGPVIFSLMEEAARERPPGGTVEWVIVPLWMMIMALVLVLAVIVAVTRFFLRRRRHVAAS